MPLGQSDASRAKYQAHVALLDSYFSMESVDLIEHNDVMDYYNIVMDSSEAFEESLKMKKMQKSIELFGNYFERMYTSAKPNE